MWWNIESAYILSKSQLNRNVVFPYLEIAAETHVYYSTFFKFASKNAEKC